jgi:hypothetical protein
MFRLLSFPDKCCILSFNGTETFPLTTEVARMRMERVCSGAMSCLLVPVKDLDYLLGCTFSMNIPDFTAL